MDSRASSSPAAGKRRRSNSGASTTTDHSRNGTPGDITDEAIAKQRAEHRAMQNRRAQLAHRQRRQAYVFGLQNRVLELEQEVRESTETVNRLKNRISVLERENRDLKQNGAVTLDLQTAETPPVSIDNSSTSINTASNSSSHSGSNSSLASSAVFWDNMLMGFGSGINWQPLPSMNPTIDNQSLGILPGLGTIPLPPSSVSTIASSSTFTPTPSPFLLAPSAPSLDEVKFRLRKYIPSLEACSAVDSYFQVAAKLTMESNLEELKLDIIRSSILWFTILDACAEIRDRPKAVEIMQPVLDLMLEQVDRIKEHITVTSPAAGTSTTDANADLFRNAISHIESLNSLESFLAVEELCDAFVIQFNLSSIEDLRLAFLRTKVIQGRLYKLCKSFEDRKLLTLALDIWRERNKEQVKTMLNKLIV